MLKIFIDKIEIKNCLKSVVKILKTKGRNLSPIDFV